MRRIFALLVVSLLAATPAQAADSPTDADLKCLLITIGGMANKDPKIRDASTMGMLYYLGRLKGREPDLDLETALLSSVASLRAADVEAEAQRCGKTMLESGQELQRLGARLSDAKPGL